MDGTENVIMFEYPRALRELSYAADDYVAPVVRLELGARSDHEPVTKLDIQPYAAAEFPKKITQPSCSVVAQAQTRTLLEKALIIHAGICRGRFGGQSSRHLYDLAMMHRAGITATVPRKLYEEVANHKFVFGDESNVRDAPVNGIRLIPEGSVLRMLESDYQRMRPMLYSTPVPPKSEELIVELAAMKVALNAL